MIQTADIVIIGGGVHGASLAFHLARRGGGKIVLLEKNSLAAGPTAKSGAMIRPLFIEAIYIQLVLASTALFENWNDSVGNDAGFVQHGFLRITKSLDCATLGGDLELLRRLTPPSAPAPFEVLTLEQTKALAPFCQFTGDETGLLFPRGGFADPVRTTTSLARAAERLGVTLIEGVAVEGIEVQNGAVRAVHTGAGTISAPLVVNCAGAWSDRIAAMAGDSLPIQVHRVPTCIFARPETLPLKGPIISDGVHRVYARALGKGLVRAAYFGWAPEAADPDDYDETIESNQLDTIREALHERVQGMKQAASFGGFSALYDMTPDGHPIAGASPKVAGLWHNCGWSGNGFAPAPAMGDNLAQLILEGRSKIDLTPFQWPRPADVRARLEMKWIHR